jgi:hypothetical protein
VRLCVLCFWPLSLRVLRMPSIRKLCRGLKGRNYAKVIGEFSYVSLKHNAISLLINCAGPGTLGSFYRLSTLSLQHGITILQRL